MADLAARLADPSRPVFLLGDVPPGEGTPPGQCQTICRKFLSRSATLASDGFIVYDIQDEPGRSDVKRPFPFRRVMDSSRYAALLARSSGKPCLVYKCVADAAFGEWIRTAVSEHGHTSINLVGRATSQDNYQGPTMNEAMDLVANYCHADKSNPPNKVHFGCVCIAERHTLEAAATRGKDYPTEHLNMIRKQKAGAQWFISQAVYDPEPTIRLLKDYAAVCRERGLQPRKVVLTFAPVARKKTMTFVKWLGVRVPEETESKILESEKPIDTSIELLCDMLQTILQECAGIGVPLGISCESVSIFKTEIDGVHTLFQRLQGILLNGRGTPWKVQWIEVMPPPNTYNEDATEESKAVLDSRQMSADKLNNDLAMACLLGNLIGGALVATGVILARQK
jgi:hypothetical protein